MRRLIAVFLLGMTTLSPALAEPDRVSILFGSHHANIQIEVEEVNPGVFLEWHIEEPPALLRSLSFDPSRKPSLVIGAFRHSFGDGALALAVSAPVFSENAFELDLVGGAAWYPGNGERVAISYGDLVPLLGLRMSYRNAFLLGLPGDRESFDALFAFGVTFPLGDQN